MNALLEIILLMLQFHISEILGTPLVTVDLEMFDQEEVDLCDIMIWVDGKPKAHFSYRMRMGVAG